MGPVPEPTLTFALPKGRILEQAMPLMSAAGIDITSTLEQADRKLLFDAVTRTLTGGDRPVLLVADDAQWCDGPSLALIHYLVRSVTGRAVLVVATTRAEDVDEQLLTGAQGAHHAHAPSLDEEQTLARRAEGDDRGATLDFASLHQRCQLAQLGRLQRGKQRHRRQRPRHALP